MIGKRAGVAALACSVLLAGCAPTGAITVDCAREAAAGSPSTCPVPFDIAAALPGTPPVRPGQVDAEVSKTTTPVPDPLTAQTRDGMSALDAAAGVSIDCDYDVGGKDFDVWLVVTPGRASVALLAPTLSRAAHLDVRQLTDFVDQQPRPGYLALTPDGDVAVARIRVDGDGDAALLVNPDGVVTGDALAKTAGELAKQVRFQRRAT